MILHNNQNDWVWIGMEYMKRRNSVRMQIKVTVFRYIKIRHNQNNQDIEKWEQGICRHPEVKCKTF